MIAARLPGKVTPESLLQDGLKIRCYCRVQFYQGRGLLSLNILNIDPDYSRGALALAREKLLQELRAKGLDQANKSKRHAPAPLLIGLISAAGSRAYSDFIHQLQSGGFPGKVLFCASNMQGEQTSQGVCDALRELWAESCDLIIITRGGGSAADLRWFDARDMAMAIASSPVPVLTAIGHHEDFCVAEEISFLKQKTPTAAADYILDQFNSLKKFLDYSMAQMQLNAERKLHLYRQSFLNLHARLQVETNRSIQALSERLTDQRHRLQEAPTRKITAMERYLEERCGKLFEKVGNQINQLSWIVDTTLPDRLHASATQHLAGAELQLVRVQARLKGSDPAPWIQGGWTRLFSRSMQKNLISIAEVKAGDKVTACLGDGNLELVVKNSIPRKRKDS